MDRALGAELCPPEPLTLGAYLAQWLDHARGRVRAKTLDGYEALIRLYALPALGQIALVDLNPLGLQGLYGELLARGLSGGDGAEPSPGADPGLGSGHPVGLLPANPAAGASLLGPGARRSGWWTPPWRRECWPRWGAPTSSFPAPSPWPPGCGEGRS
jgi:hypothetical protein